MLLLIHIVFSLLLTLVKTEDQVCFGADKIKELLQTNYMNVAILVASACKEADPSLSEKGIQLCLIEKFRKATKTCTEQSKDKPSYQCVLKELNVDMSKIYVFEDFKKMIVSFANTNVKELVGKTVDACKSETDVFYCGLKALANGPCPALKRIIG